MYISRETMIAKEVINKKTIPAVTPPIMPALLVSGKAEHVYNPY